MKAENTKRLSQWADHNKKDELTDLPTFLSAIKQSPGSPNTKFNGSSYWSIISFA